MGASPEAVPDDVAALKEALAVARAKASEDAALIAEQKLRIARLERQIYGQRSERSSRLIDQLALTFEELQASATEDELAAEKAVAKVTSIRGFTRQRPERNTFPDHLPRERVVIDPPTACACCGGNRLRKLGEDVTCTLESIPRQWKVIETVREKFTCRDCEKATGRVRRQKNRVTHFPARTTVPGCNFLPKRKATKFEFRKFFFDLPAQAIFIAFSRALAPSGKHPKPIALSFYEKHPSAFRSHKLRGFRHSL
jgi:transposase IS166 family protein/transposase IS66-like protein